MLLSGINTLFPFWRDERLEKKDSSLARTDTDSFTEALTRTMMREEGARSSRLESRELIESVKALASLQLHQMNMALSQIAGNSSVGSLPGISMTDASDAGWIGSLTELLALAGEGAAGSLVESEEAAIDPRSHRQNFDALIQKAATVTRLDPELVRAVIKAESGFAPGAESPAGAMGLMQLMPGTARELGLTDAFDPLQNVFGGCVYLKQMLNRYSGDLNRALAAYNWGPGNLDRSNGRLPRETRDYLERVNTYYNQNRQPDSS